MIDEETQPATGTTPEEWGSSASSKGSQTPPVERWLAEHGDVLWRFTLGRTRSREVAEEIVQETILAAMQGYSKFAGTSSQRTWLLGIAAHKIADHFRALRRRTGTLESGSPDNPSADESASDHFESVATFTLEGMWAKPPSSWGLNAASKTENAEMLAALRHCINALPPSQSEALWLRDLLNIPGAEVCKAMGISPTNLWSQMHRARAALRACVEKSMGLGREGKGKGRGGKGQGGKQ